MLESVIFSLQFLNEFYRIGMKDSVDIPIMFTFNSFSFINIFVYNTIIIKIVNTMYRC